MKQRIAFGVALVVALAAIAVAFLRGKPDDPGDGFLYDVSEKRLYRATRTSFAPEPGVGGESGDGVEAVVVRCEQCPVENNRIAYLRSHSPEYKTKRDESIRSGNDIEGLTRAWISENTLVRLLDGDKWLTASSKEGVKIVSGWKRRCPTHGQWEKPVRPK